MNGWSQLDFLGIFTIVRGEIGGQINKFFIDYGNAVGGMKMKLQITKLNIH